MKPSWFTASTRARSACGARSWKRVRLVLRKMAPATPQAKIVATRANRDWSRNAIDQNPKNASVYIALSVQRKTPNFTMSQFAVPPEGISFKDVITDFEKRLIESTLEAAGGVQKRAAELLHIKPTTLNEMIKRYEIRPRRKRTGTGTGTEPAPVAGTHRMETQPTAQTVVPVPAFDDK